jgi:predicted DNA-binding transcriptional regulator YafY
VKVLKGHFNFPNNLFAEDFFVNSFGVMIPPGDVKPLDIILRAKSDERFYLKDIPLHGSQQIVREELEYVDFSYHLVPSNDFIGAILHQGDRLEVIAPKDLRNQVKTQLEKAYNLYLND